MSGACCDTSTDIADLLLDAKVPFVFATGYGDTITIPDRFKAVPIVPKPVSGTLPAEKMAAAQTLTNQQNDVA